MSRLVRYIVTFADTPDTRKFFGPFVNETVAWSFTRDLPKPLKGGYVSVAPIYLGSDLPLIKDMISRERVH